ncbi:MAG: RagB/SusD family nutrient uptake outer membrane protein [Bacteroidales bacterium]|jgi:hypothetical protein|nr:RagB/SusD family nutrient uptake outer membrane protein [Bacteroidales bacterium]
MRKIFIAASMGIILFSSCVRLEPEVYSDVLKDDYYKTPEQFATLLANAYSQLAGEYGYVYREGYWSLQEYTSDEVAVPVRGTDWDDAGAPLAMQQHTWDYQSREVSNGWSFAYGGVTKCNEVLGNIEMIKGSDTVSYDEATKSGIAETKALRAFYHLLAMDIYGNVPIVLSLDAKLHQSTRAEVFAFIESELLENLPSLQKNPSYGRMTQAVAHTILAKLYLNAEVYTGTARWQDAIDRCEEILTGGYGYVLSPDYFTTFGKDNTNNAEIIFPVVFDAVRAQGNMFHLMTQHYAMKEVYKYSTDCWNGPCTHQAFYDAYSTSDLRKKQWFVGPIVKENGDTVGYAYDESGTKPAIIRPYISATIDATKKNTFDGARFFKFEVEPGIGHHANSDFPVFRLADIYLMKAEAIMRLNGGAATSDAVDAANFVRRRAGVEEYNTSTLTLDELLAERGRELAWEGFRRQDLIRFKKFHEDWGVYDWGIYKRYQPKGVNRDVPQGNSYTSYIFPIPKWVMDAAPGIYTQNPGY